MTLMRKIFGTDSKIDLSQPVFFGKQLRQAGYDREIDEGMSSGMRRYATLDITALSERQTKKIIKRMVGAAKDFNLCKLVQVGGFTREGRRYLTVSGESHTLYQNPVKNLMLERIMPLVDKLPIEYVESCISPPVQGQPYQPINLGPYGSTGGNPNLKNPQPRIDNYVTLPSPAGQPTIDLGLGIPMHPAAQELRDRGEIR